MSVLEHWLQGKWYFWGLIVHQQRYWSSDSNKNVDITFPFDLIDYPGYKKTNA
jgi:hypothetical protein